MKRVGCGDQCRWRIVNEGTSERGPVNEVHETALTAGGFWLERGSTVHSVRGREASSVHLAYFGSDEKRLAGGGARG